MSTTVTTPPDVRECLALSSTHTVAREWVRSAEQLIVWVVRTSPLEALPPRLRAARTEYDAAVLAERVAAAAMARVAPGGAL